MKPVKRSYFPILLFLGIIIITGCSGKPEPELPSLTVDEISAERLWERISEESPYKNYSFWPGHEGLLPGQAPHGVYHKVYINRILNEQLPIAGLSAPEGSIIVKENFTVDEEPAAITVMVKVKDFAPDSGDWFWARYNPDGTAGPSGLVQSCLDCHSGVADNDYIVIHPLDSSLSEKAPAN
jgi:hypothetical protein